MWPSLRRCYSTTKPSIKLVAELRKLTEVSLVKAREALAASDNHVDAALEWLNNDLAASGAKKSRQEGLISVSLLSPGVDGRSALRAAMIELNCETDFVGRNELFGQLAADIAHTAAFMSDYSDFQQYPVDVLNDTPLLSARNPTPDPTVTVSRAIRDLISKVGENLVLRRAVTIFQEPTQTPKRGQRLISYLHGSIRDPAQGRIGVLGLLSLSSPAAIFESNPNRESLERLERALARQIAGFDTRSVRSDSKDETTLYEQPFMIPGELSGKPVGDALATWARSHDLGENGLKVEQFVKWTVGEPVGSS
ncbi:elongation factor TS-domain-containing protein [Mycena amicta]|nr:elongation factor TS-domain-containing protein [Mycena amicta]